MNIKLSMLDTRLRNHLYSNGSITDQIGLQLGIKFVDQALTDPTIKGAARQYDFTSEDLGVAYIAMIECLANPCIKLVPNPTIPPMLVATLVFKDLSRLESFLGAVHRKCTPGITAEVRRLMIVETAHDLAHQIWNTNTMEHGEAPFHVDPTGTGLSSAGGCLGAFLFGIIGPLRYCFAKR